jgi:hypothetical protein
MVVRQFLFACVLGACSFEAAAATTDSAQDSVTGSPRPAVDSGSSLREGGGGDTPEARDAAASPGAASSAGNAGGGDDSRLGSPTPTTVHRSNLGWQSLLPGSIQ